MTDTPPSTHNTMTSSFMLQELKNPQNNSVWSEFVTRYRPVIIGYCKRFGFTGADAEDISQMVLTTFTQAYQDGKATAHCFANTCNHFAQEPGPVFPAAGCWAYDRGFKCLLHGPFGCVFDGPLWLAGGLCERLI